MFRLRPGQFSWVLASLFCVGCNETGLNVAPEPSGSTAPPILTARGTLAVVNRADANVARVWIYPPHSDQLAHEIPFHGTQFAPNSLAFDHRGNLYIGYNDTSPSGNYHVIEVNLRHFAVVRAIIVPQWTNSSVAVDDDNELYVNTKSLIGGDIKVFRNDTSTNPYLEIKDPQSPLTMFVSHTALWVGYQGPFAYALARYRLRSTERLWFQSIGNAAPLTLAPNPEGSLIATLVRRNSTRAVDVIDVNSGKRARTLEEGSNLLALTTDESGDVYISEGASRNPGKVNTCTFRGCTFSFETATRPLELAVSPVDGTLYVGTFDKPSVEVFDPGTGKSVMTVVVASIAPAALAIEP